MKRVNTKYIVHLFFFCYTFSFFLASVVIMSHLSLRSRDVRATFEEAYHSHTLLTKFNLYAITALILKLCTFQICTSQIKVLSPGTHFSWSCGTQLMMWEPSEIHHCFKKQLFLKFKKTFREKPYNGVAICNKGP